MKKILIIGPSWVGDMVMAQALLRLLKQRMQDCVLHVLAPAWTFSLIKAMPEVSDAIEMPIAHGELQLRKRFQIARSLKHAGYDQAIILPNSFKSALIPWLAGIPVRTGWRGEFRYGLVNDLRKLNKQTHALMVEQYLALGLEKNAPLPANYPVPSFKVELTKANAIRNQHHIPQAEKVLALCAGAEFGPSKRWPAAYYAKVANEKLAEGWAVWLFGSPKDRMITDEIMQLTEQRCINLAGQLQLHETLSLLSLVSGVVTNDSGLMHVAAALEKPLIAIYGSTSDSFTPPLSKSSQVLKLNLACRPCFQRECPLKHHQCMLGITPESVLTHMQSWGAACKSC